MTPPRPFLLVGLTGGIATGKSTVDAVLRELGAIIIDADVLAREVVEPGEPALAEIAAEFGSGVLGPDGRLDRKALGAIVFADGDRRRKLEAMTHPRIRERFQQKIDALTAENFHGLVFFDAPVMIESGSYRNMDRLVVVITDEPTQIARLMARDGIDRDEALRKIRSQMPLAEKAELADYVIDNSGDPAATAASTRQVYRALLGLTNMGGLATGPPSPPTLVAPRQSRGAPQETPTGPSGQSRVNVRRRALGQHFLRDSTIARAIVDLVAPAASDLVVEIGPGEGALTAELARRAGRLIALEVDEALAARLRPRFPGVEIVEADARTWDYGMLVAPPGGRVLVVGNLPYSVGKPILMALVAARTAIDAMALMLQREVAERVAAAPGSRVYGSLSVLTQLYCDVDLALRVPPGAFRPPPKVDSAVIRLGVLRSPRVELADERRFHVVVRAAFAQRRKTLANALAAGLGRSAESLRASVEAAGIDPTRRAETLTMFEFAELTRLLS